MTQNKKISYYHIVIDSELDKTWSIWFDCETLTYQNGQTSFTIQVPDQAALYGVLIKIFNLGIPLVSLQRIDHDY